MKATLLTKRWFDHRGGLCLEFWVRHAQGPGRVTINSEKAVFFVDRGQAVGRGTRRPVDLRSMDGNPVDAVYFSTQKDLLSARSQLERSHYLPFEADIWPSDRFLMERFVTGSMEILGDPVKRAGFLEWTNPTIYAAEAGPRPRTLSFDIETEGLDGRVISIAGVYEGESRVFMDTDVVHDAFTSCAGEAETIGAFQRWLVAKDPDLLIGWNVVGFDLRVLCERASLCGLDLRLGRGSGRTSVRPSHRLNRSVASVEGRMVLDGIATLKSSGYNAASFSLEGVSQTLLGEGKAIHQGRDPVAEIMRMLREAPAELAAYNLKDCALVDRIFERQDLLGFVLERQQLTGLPMDQQGGSVAAFDYLYLPRLHRRGRVARTIDSSTPGEMSPGGLVLPARPGLFKNVLVLDFKSLYPSIMRTFKVDPLSLVTVTKDGIPGFNGAVFHRTEHILPALLRELWAARDKAKVRGDKPRSAAIKVVMNSFYGVLGSKGCRFFDPRLPSSITLRGQALIMESKGLLEDWGFEVVYGDTDSVFVRVGDGLSPTECRGLGTELAAKLNAHFVAALDERYGIASHLEMEFEVHYLQLYLATKKRYAGQIETIGGERDMVFKGLEVVRTDWTPLARNFQRELFARVFAGERDGLAEWIRGEVAAVRAGETDDQLVYTKRLRRDVSEYQKNTPPHVRAARMLGGSPNKVSYVITTRGPQPVSLRTAAIDYEHYVDRQLRPVAQGILSMLGLDFARFSSQQLTLF